MKKEAQAVTPIQLSGATMGPPVAAAHGLQWWSSAFAWLFADVARLGVWVGMWLCCFVMLGALHFVPVLGSAASFLLYFVFCGGLMVAAQRSAQGATPPFGDLFGGFGPRAGALLGAGLVVFAGNLLIVGLMLAIGVGAFVTALVGGAVTALSFPPLSALGLGTGTAALLVLCLALLIPLSMAAWLAPALIMLRGARPMDALQLSLRAARASIGALVVYGLAFVVLALAATLMLGVGWLVLAPLMFLSSYAAFEDLFDNQVQVLG